MAESKSTPSVAPSDKSGSTLWEQTKEFSANAYNNTLKPGFDKVYYTVDKLGPHVNRLSNKVGGEAFWPTTMDKESEKAARIIRGFCKDGFADKTGEELETGKSTEEKVKDGIPQGKQRVVKKIPPEVIKNAKALAIYTNMRTGWVIGGSGGAGVMIARNPDTGEWGAPSGIMTHCYSVGFLAGVDILDTVLVINSYEALEAFTRLRLTLGTDIAVVAGPVGVGGGVDQEFKKKISPVWSYVKSRGLYAGVGVAGQGILERNDENAKFYGYEVSAAEIFAGKVRHPPTEQYKVLLDTLKAAEGQDIDESLLPAAGVAPSDMDVDLEENKFGIPKQDDPDPYGVKALEAEGMIIREAGTKQRPSADAFEFRPSPSSPIYGHFSRASQDKTRSQTWRSSTQSLASVDRGTQMSDDDVRSLSHSPKRGSLATAVVASPVKIPGTVDDDDDDDDDDDNDDDPTETFHDVDIGETKPVDSSRGRASLDMDDASDVEIHTAIPVVRKARIVSVPKRPPPPALPPRNPERAIATTTATSTKEDYGSKDADGVPGPVH